LLSASRVTHTDGEDERSEGVREQVARNLKEFGFEPKGHTRSYRKPYPNFFDTVPYPRGFRIPDFVKFSRDDSKTTYEHVGQYLAQVSEIGITDAHKVKLFPLSLSSTAFNWFTSLAPNSVTTWACLEQKFHDYFYYGDTELKLSHLTMVRQKYNETVSEYIRKFRETRNKCYSLTLGEKDLADLAFIGLSSYLREKLEGQDFTDINQVMQHAITHESRARDNKQYSRFRDMNGREKEKKGVNMLEPNNDSDEETDVCVAEWVDAPKVRPMACAFLKPSPGKREEMKYTFDVSKCDKLSNILL
jgi:hypothetical protein